MKGLTKPQAKIFNYVDTFIKSNGYSPTFRDIQSHFGFASLGSVYTYIKTLKKKGYLLDQRNASVAIGTHEAVPSSTELTIPFIGHIAAGFPIETFHQTQSVAVPSRFISNAEQTYALKARGDTLIDEHIADGDLIIIEARSLANEGELIIATVNYRDTIVKRFFPEGDYIRLESSDGRHESIILNASEIQIQGIIIALIRSYI
jgi:repressor LexA